MSAALQARERPEVKPEPIDDEVFFHRAQVEVGTVLVYMGRTDPYSLWQVFRIASAFAPPRDQKNARYTSRDVESVRHLTDDIFLRRVGGKETRSAAFYYLSYSAIWRLSPVIRRARR
jgi:hypothetical protein